MIEIIKRNIDYFAWDNFFNSQVYIHWIFNLLLIFLFLWLGFLFTYLILSGSKSKSYFNSIIEEFVIRASAGIAIHSFLLAIIGLTGILNFWFYLGFNILIVVFSFYKNEIINSLSLFLKVLKKYKYLWILFIITSLPALLPPYRYDEMSFHFAYPMQWAESGQIHVDPLIRNPLYTFNMHTLWVIGFWLTGATFNHLLVWLTGIMATLGIISLLKRLNVDNFLVYLGGLAFFFTPLVQRYLNVGYVDVPLMFYMLLCVYGIILFMKNYNCKGITILCAMIVAMFVGLKPTGALFVPFILLFVLWKIPWRKTLIFLIIFCILGGLWYIRNIVIDADPIPPVVNMMLGKQDLHWSEKDHQMRMEHLADFGFEKKDWRLIYRYPMEMVLGTENKLKVGNNWPLLGYVFLFPFSLILLFLRNINREFKFILIFSLIGIIIWLSTAVIIRYAHFLCLMIVCSIFFSDMVLNRMLYWFKNYRAMTRYSAYALLFFLVMGPTANAFSYYKQNFREKIPFSKREKHNFAGYGKPGVLNMISNLSQYGAHKNDTIYTNGFTYYKYYFQKEGYYLIGDVFHKYRYSDFYDSVKNKKLYSFLCSANADYLFLDKTHSVFKKTEGFRELVNKEARLKPVKEIRRAMLIKVQYNNNEER